MINRVIYVSLLFFSFYRSAYSQEDTLFLVSTPFIAIGYAHESSQYVREFYDNILDNYRSYGIPIPTQVPFGRTISVNGGILFSWMTDAAIGLSIGYSYSPAYSNYKDYSGTLEVNGSTSVLDMCIKGQIIVTKISTFQMDLNVQGGVSRGTASITQALHYSDNPDFNYDGKWSTSAWGPFSQVTLGFPVQCGDYTVSFEGGYRYSSGQVTNQTIESGAGSITTDYHWDIGQSGFVFLVSCGLKL